jgi:hypothetical protein
MHNAWLDPEPSDRRNTITIHRDEQDKQDKESGHHEKASEAFQTK